jgi:FkbM family methyltransferase
MKTSAYKILEILISALFLVVYKKRVKNIKEYVKNYREWRENTNLHTSTHNRASYGGNMLELIRLLKYDYKINKTTTKCAFNTVFDVSFRDENSKVLYVTKTYEEETLKYLQKIIKKDDVFLDIGANVGIYSIIAAQLGAKTISFEPSSREFNRFIKNISLNHNVRNRIALNNIALSDYNGKASLIVANKYNSGHNTLEKELMYKTQEDCKQQVECSTLDEYCKKTNLQKINAIKIDVEGHEEKVLKGAFQTIIKLKPKYIIYEIVDKNVSSKWLGVKKMLSELGYRSYYITNQGHLVENEIYTSGNLVATTD